MIGDRLAGGLGSLQGQEHQAVVVELALAVDQLGPAAGGRLAERELVLVHQADHGVGALDLPHLAADLVVLPAPDLDHRPGRMRPAGNPQQPRHERSVGRVGDHHRPVARSPPADDDAGARLGRRGGGRQRGDENRMNENRRSVHRDASPMRFPDEDMMVPAPLSRRHRAFSPHPKPATRLFPSVLGSKEGEEVAQLLAGQSPREPFGHQRGLRAAQPLDLVAAQPGFRPARIANDERRPRPAGRSGRRAPGRRRSRRCSGS